MSAAQAVPALIVACLTPTLVRVARLVDDAGGPEDLHRLRVELRRLRTVLRLSQDWVPWTLPQLPLAELFARLGPARDREVLQTHWLPALAAAGAPPVQLPAMTLETQPAEVLRSAAARQLFDALAALSRAPDQAQDPGIRPLVDSHLRERVCAGLEADLRWLRRRARHADRLDDESLHLVRKRVKRLRYAVELTARLFGRRKVARFLKKLALLQDTLGRFNDLHSAHTLFTRLAQTQPPAWFAVGWLTARQDVARRDCRRALLRLADLRRCW
jgi:triphosphatase